MIPENLKQFIQQFSKLPGIGYKTSERLGFYIISRPELFSEELSDAILSLKKNSKICSLCGNISDSDPCGICSDPYRDKALLCIVEQPVDIYYIESTDSYKGLYHVLGGLISPLDGISPKNLAIDSLIQKVRSGSIKEIIFATSPTTEGDTTALYIKEFLKESNIKTTHLARGIPVGTGLQYAGNTSIQQAIKNREAL
jgi:recombination protein RecR